MTELTVLWPSTKLVVFTGLVTPMNTFLSLRTLAAIPTPMQ